MECCACERDAYDVSETLFVALGPVRVGMFSGWSVRAECVIDVLLLNRICRTKMFRMSPIEKACSTVASHSHRTFAGWNISEQTTCIIIIIIGVVRVASFFRLDVCGFAAGRLGDPARLPESGELQKVRTLICTPASLLRLVLQLETSQPKQDAPCTYNMWTKHRLSLSMSAHSMVSVGFVCGCMCVCTFGTRDGGDGRNHGGPATAPKRFVFPITAHLEPTWTAAPEVRHSADRGPRKLARPHHGPLGSWPSFTAAHHSSNRDQGVRQGKREREREREREKKALSQNHFPRGIWRARRRTISAP
jgi:hypothetical protein